MWCGKEKMINSYHGQIESLDIDIAGEHKNENLSEVDDIATRATWPVGS